MQEPSEDEGQIKVAESLSSKADGCQRGVELEKNTTGLEIVRSEGTIKAIRTPVIVSPIKRTRSMTEKKLAQDEPSTSSKAKRHEDPPSSSIRSNLLAMQQEFETKDLQQLPDKKFSLTEGIPGRSFEQESRESSPSRKINKINENLDNWNKKGIESFSKTLEAKRSKSMDSLSRINSKDNLTIPTDFDVRDSGAEDIFSGRPSTSTGASCSYDSSAGEVSNPDTKQKLPLVCKHCNKDFTVRSNYNRHVRVHTGEKTFFCESCPQTFARSDQLKLHNTRIHTKERPYQCDVCLNSFATSYEHNLHSRRHTGEMPHRCLICNKAFTKKVYLKRHSTKHNPEVTEI